MVHGSAKKLKIKNICNQAFDTDEILWLLKGNENMTAKEFVCKCILDVQPENIMDVFEYEDE